MSAQKQFQETRRVPGLKNYLKWWEIQLAIHPIVGDRIVANFMQASASLPELYNKIRYF